MSWSDRDKYEDADRDVTARDWQDAEDQAFRDIDDFQNWIGSHGFGMHLPSIDRTSHPKDLDLCGLLAALLQAGREESHDAIALANELARRYVNYMDRHIEHWARGE